jgi:pre-rRNA-processing protein TSR3
VENSPRLTVYHANQCAPKRCTGLKLRRFGFARVVKKIRFLPKRAVVLNPFSKIAFSPSDRERVKNFGLVALDCSWEHVEKVILKHVKGTSRCLPILIAGNPVNFGKATKLTTVEALAAGLYISGFKKKAKSILAVFSWGHSFLDLNHNLLERYSMAMNSSEIIRMQNDISID